MRKVLVFFGQLNDQDVEWMTSHGVRQAVPAGTDLIVEGEQCDSMYIVLDGRLSVRPSATGGKAIARLSAGEMVGEMSFVDSRPPSATVTAHDNAVVLAVHKDDLEDKLADDRDFAGRFYKALAVYLSQQVRRDLKLFAQGVEIDAEKLDQDTEDELDELDDTVLDAIHLAGSRFDRMIRKVMS